MRGSARGASPVHVGFYNVALTDVEGREQQTDMRGNEPSRRL